MNGKEELGGEVKGKHYLHYYNNKKEVVKRDSRTQKVKISLCRKNCICNFFPIKRFRNIDR